MMRILPDYSAHVLHTTVAAPRAEIWRLLVGIFAMVALYLLMGLF